MAEPTQPRQIQDVVARPKTTPVASTTETEPQTITGISMHQKGMATRDSQSSGNSAATAENVSDAAKLVSNTANTITPPTAENETVVNEEKVEDDGTNAKEIDTATASIDEEPEPTNDAPIETTNESEEEHEEQVTTHESSLYEAQDSLPDAIDIQRTELTNKMQTPRIYDTTEYVVPIKDTMHTHGHIVGTIIAGIISAAVVLAVVVAVAFFIV